MCDLKLPVDCVGSCVGSVGSEMDDTLTLIGKE